MAADFLAILDKSVTGKDIVLEAGEAVFKQGDAIRSLYRIVSGRVRLSRVLARGSEITLAQMVGGDILAEASVFGAHYHCDAITETQSEARRYSMREIHALLKGESGAAIA